MLKVGVLVPVLSVNRHLLGVAFSVYEKGKKKTINVYPVYPSVPVEEFTKEELDRIREYTPTKVLLSAAEELSETDFCITTLSENQTASVLFYPAVKEKPEIQITLRNQAKRLSLLLAKNNFLYVPEPDTEEISLSAFVPFKILERPLKIVKGILDMLDLTEISESDGEYYLGGKIVGKVSPVKGAFRDYYLLLLQIEKYRESKQKQDSVKVSRLISVVEKAFEGKEKTEEVKTEESEEDSPQKPNCTQKKEPLSPETKEVIRKGVYVPSKDEELKTEEERTGEPAEEIETEETEEPGSPFQPPSEPAPAGVLRRPSGTISRRRRFREQTEITEESERKQQEQPAVEEQAEEEELPLPEETESVASVKYQHVAETLCLSFLRAVSRYTETPVMKFIGFRSSYEKQVYGELYRMYGIPFYDTAYLLANYSVKRGIWRLGKEYRPDFKALAEFLISEMERLEEDVFFYRKEEERKVYAALSLMRENLGKVADSAQKSGAAVIIPDKELLNKGFRKLNSDGLDEFDFVFSNENTRDITRQRLKEIFTAEPFEGEERYLFTWSRLNGLFRSAEERFRPAGQNWFADYVGLLKKLAEETEYEDKDSFLRFLQEFREKFFLFLAPEFELRSYHLVVCSGSEC